MTRSAVLRTEIEHSLANRFPVALSPQARVAPVRTLCGIAALDEMLDGGVPAGGITEFVGTACSGRTTAALAYAAAMTRAGAVCAWIDSADVLDPESVAASGVDLERLLWMRCGVGAKVVCDVPAEVQTGALRSVESVALQPRHTGGGSPHPRSEGRDMPEAVGALLRAHGGLHDHQTRRERRAVGTPGAANRPISQRAGGSKPSGEREEQVNSDRLPARRGENLTLAPRCAELQTIARGAEPLTIARGAEPLNIAARCAEVQPRRVARLATSERLMGVGTEAGRLGRSVRPWPVLDQALRATDLLLQGGGFGAIFLDLGSIPAEAAWRIPLATWFRFRAACERTRASLVVLTQHPCARSSAEAVVRLQGAGMEVEGGVMTGIRYRAATERRRRDAGEGRVVPIRKPPVSERAGEWRSQAAWGQAAWGQAR